FKYMGDLTGKRGKREAPGMAQNRICVILRPVAALAALRITGHILVYAPRNPSLAALPQTG
ncbi:hypothetical protein ABN09_14645, partial [Morganella morganii]